MNKYSKKRIEKLKAELNNIPDDLCFKIAKHLYTIGKTRLYPSSRKIINYFKKNYLNKERR